MRTLAGCMALFAISQVSISQIHAASKIVVVDVDGMIHPVTAEIVGHAIDQAAAEHASAVLMRINTPGGLLEATRDITSKMIASRVPVIAYITPTGARG